MTTVIITVQDRYGQTTEMFLRPELTRYCRERDLEVVRIYRKEVR